MRCDARATCDRPSSSLIRNFSGMTTAVPAPSSPATLAGTSSQTIARSWICTGRTRKAVAFESNSPSCALLKVHHGTNIFCPQSGRLPQCGESTERSSDLLLIIVRRRSVRDLAWTGFSTQESPLSCCRRYWAASEEAISVGFLSTEELSTRWPSGKV